MRALTVRQPWASVPATGRQGLWIPGPDVVELLPGEVPT